ncbi:hypothetical protein HGR00_05260 [Ralstonia insidiosa]|uniref:Uncharacterized protein n=1 Tax=Ralstonia insidiosa TaxID=190721 RepID=A0A848NVD8_9RALS|nr:hypothetical protein [Ralstonia insidiosa]
MLRQGLFLIVLTLVYLTFELGFNARLLDVVGGDTTIDDVHRIEFFGRTLSGIAAALVVLQLMLTHRAKKGTGKPRYKTIAVWFGVTVLVVYFAIKTLVDGVVYTRDAEFRRIAVNSVLLQRSLVQGRLKLDGLVEDEALFARPEGKAFLALFPFLAVSVDRLDEKTRTVKEALVRTSVRRAKPAQSYYENYREAMTQTRAKWQQYTRIPTASDEGLRNQQDRAWNDYRNQLARRGWQPATVPARARGAVVKHVRRSVPVPTNWDPADEATFRAAVEQRYRQQMSASARSITVGNDHIPPGLSYEAFAARPGVQQELRQMLKLPQQTRVATAYGSAADFTPLYNAFVDDQVRQELVKYEASPRDFANGGKYQQAGIDATRAAVVPAIALFFSLLGAIGHFSKLLYLLAKTLLLLRAPADGRLTRGAALIATGVLLTTLSGVWVSLSYTDNAITRSPLFTQMLQWARGANSVDGVSASTGRSVLTNIAHVVAVGQGYGYPINESIRTRVLQGLSYGYHPAGS